jgi:hypothetical protein
MCPLKICIEYNNRYCTYDPRVCCLGTNNQDYGLARHILISVYRERHKIHHEVRYHVPHCSCASAGINHNMFYCAQRFNFYGGMHRCLQAAAAQRLGGLTSAPNYGELCASNGNDYRSQGEIERHNSQAAQMKAMNEASFHRTSPNTGFVGTVNPDQSIRKMEKFCSGPSSGTPGSWSCN